MSVTFGAELRACREARGWTQARVPEAAGPSVPGVSAVERGHRRPSLRAPFALSPALRLGADELARATAERLSGS